MTALLLLAMVLTALLVEALLTRRQFQQHVAPAPAYAALHLPAATFLASGHSWVVLGADETFAVGIDALVAHIIATPRNVDLPLQGAQLERGDPLVTLEFADGRLVLRAPFAAEVVARNTELALHPRSVTTDPYGSGWLVKLRSADPLRCLSVLSLGPPARARLAHEQRRLVDLVAESLGTPCAADGGVLERGAMVALGPAGLKMLQRFLDDASADACDLREPRTGAMLGKEGR